MAFIANRDALFQHLSTLMCACVSVCRYVHCVAENIGKRKFALLLEIGKLYSHTADRQNY